MKLYEVESTRWYFSVIKYRVIADSENDAIQRASGGELRDGVLEISASAPTWNGEEEYLESEVVKTAHDMNIEDDGEYDHTNCQYMGNHLWDCGHSDATIGESGWVQLPLWPLSKSWNEDIV